MRNCFGEMLQRRRLFPLLAGLSPGLAALTVGCHSGNLSSISRVQLLLLDRVKPEDEELSPLHDWSCFRMQGDAGLTSSGIPTTSRCSTVFLLKCDL